MMPIYRDPRLAAPINFLIILILLTDVDSLSFIAKAPHSRSCYHQQCHRRCDSILSCTSRTRALWSGLWPLSVEEAGLGGAVTSLTADDNDSNNISTPITGVTAWVPLREAALGTVVVLDYAPRLVAVTLLGRFLSRGVIRPYLQATLMLELVAPLPLLYARLCGVAVALVGAADAVWTAVTAALGVVTTAALALPLLPRLLYVAFLVETVIKMNAAAAAGAVASTLGTDLSMWWGVCALDVVAVPIAEEVAHRGVLQGGLTQAGQVVQRVGAVAAALLVGSTTDTNRNDNDERCFDSGRSISAVSTMFLRVLGAAYFASLHLSQDRSALNDLVDRHSWTGIVDLRFASFSSAATAVPGHSVIPPQVRTAAAAAAATTTTSVLFGSPSSVIRYQRCVSAFMMSLLVYFPLAQRLNQPLRPCRSTTAMTMTTTTTTIVPEATSSRIAPSLSPPQTSPPPSFISPFFPVAAIAAHATWNAIAWSPPARLLDAVGATALVCGPGAIGVGRLVAAAAAFETSAYASRWLAAALARAFHLPVRLAADISGGNSRDDGGDCSNGNGCDSSSSNNVHRLFRLPAYQPPWFRCAQPLSRSLFLSALAAFWVATCVESRCGGGVWEMRSNEASDRAIQNGMRT